MMQEKNLGRLFMNTCCAVYIILMLLLLYAKGIDACGFRMRAAQSQGYWQIVRRYANFELLKSVRPFLQTMRGMQLRDLIFNQVAGNYLIFIPAGIFLPFYYRKQRKLKCFFLTSLLLILLIEISQVLTFLGSFDVDDILLNLAGCLTGWILFTLIRGFLHLFHIV